MNFVSNGRITKESVRMGRKIADLIIEAEESGVAAATLAATVRHLVLMHGYKPTKVIEVSTGILAGVNSELKRAVKRDDLDKDAKFETVPPV